MKKHNGFISNSSSTSFIVPAQCKKEAEAQGLELIPVAKIKAIFKEFEDLGFDFYFESHSWKITELNDEDFISQPFDRDRAYEQGIDYGVFEEDL